MSGGLQLTSRLFEVLKRRFIIMFLFKHLFLIFQPILCGFYVCFLSNNRKDNKSFRNMCVCLGKVRKGFIVCFTRCKLDCEPCSAHFKTLGK